MYQLQKIYEEFGGYVFVIHTPGGLLKFFDLDIIHGYGQVLTYFCLLEADLVL
jgi:hypothetical protein